MPLIFLFLVSFGFTFKPIDLNKVTFEELRDLPGIGSYLALKILEYRNSQGCFKSLDELKNIKGIGEKRFNIIKNFLFVGPCEKNPSLTNRTSLTFKKPFSKDKINKTIKVKIYYYTDENGVIHFTQFPESIPKRYKKKVFKFTK